MRRFYLYWQLASIRLVLAVVSLRELVFKADGTFQATFTPFEIYHDYWENYTPENLDLQGKYQIDETGGLVLKYIWLGRSDKADPVGRGHVFEK